MIDIIAHVSWVGSVLHISGPVHHDGRCRIYMINMIDMIYTVCMIYIISSSSCIRCLKYLKQGWTAQVGLRLPEALATV